MSDERFENGARVVIRGIDGKNGAEAEIVSFDDASATYECKLLAEDFDGEKVFCKAESLERVVDDKADDPEKRLANLVKEAGRERSASSSKKRKKDSKKKKKKKKKSSSSDSSSSSSSRSRSSSTNAPNRKKRGMMFNKSALEIAEKDKKRHRRDREGGAAAAAALLGLR
ncbi:unnamed protein product [Symbiodinium natans]|uniref:Uncharacterized protein n=1 Tax=Symbiodinium natans TaxID=878477 RepID=A0A812M9A9_9DINO|nr:unnamed protein product [Symbiodinium natans]